MKNYKIGISPIGLLALILVMAPNIIYLFAAPPNDVLTANSAKLALWNAVENIGRYGTMISLCVVVSRKPMRKNRIIDVITLCPLIIYFILWAAYFNGIFNGLALAGMAVFPSLFFIMTAWKLRNIISLFFSVLFAIAHIGITCSNFLI